MRNFLIAIVCIAGLLGLAAKSADNCCKGKSENKCDCMKYLKGAKVEVTNIENGAVIKITADKPEVIKQVQNWANKSFVVIKDSGETKTSGMVKDPVCGMEIDKAQALTTDYNGKTYYFCSQSCKDKFLQEPAKYAK